MAFNTNRLGRVYQQITDEAAEIDRQATSLRAQLAAGNVGSSQIVDWYILLGQSRASLASLVSTPGLAAYAKGEANSDTYDITAEWSAMVAAIDNALSWITTNFPKDGSGYLLARQFSNGSVVDRTFAPAATAGLRTILDTISAAIN